MYILFTTSSKPLAKLIRWATGEDCSHVAMLLPGLGWGPVVLHANHYGVNLMPYDLFLQENTVIHKVEVPTDSGRIHGLLNGTWNSPYDLGALLFTGIMLLCRNLLGLRKWPKQNLWQSSGMFMCTELVEEYLGGELDPLMTPYKMYVQLSNTQKENKE